MIHSFSFLWKKVRAKCIITALAFAKYNKIMNYFLLAIVALAGVALGMYLALRSKK